MHCRQTSFVQGRFCAQTKNRARSKVISQRPMKRPVTISILISLAFGGCWVSLAGQQPRSPSGVSISLEEAIKRAQSSNTAFAGANADAQVAQSERTIARSALLPN